MTKEKDCITNGYDILQELAKPMEDNEIEWKVQTVMQGQNGLKALVVPYVQARAIQNRLDQVCGLKWKSSFNVLDLGKFVAVECTISVFDNGEWIHRSDAAELTNIEAIKGGYSDSMKRAAVQYGIGRFLYSLPQQWVNILPNRPQQPHEYINSRYKVNGQQQYVKGYFIRPSVSQILKPGSNSRPQQQQPKQTQQRGKQPQQQHQPPMNTNTIPNEKELQEVRRHVVSCLQQLKIPQGYLPNLFNKVNVQGYSSIEQASYPELQRLYEMLGPVKMYMYLGKEQFNLSEQQLLGYASELLQQPIGKVSNLFNKLDSEGVKMIFNRIREQQTQQKMA